MSIGAPGEGVRNIAEAGAVNVLYGSGTGLTAIVAQVVEVLLD